jgi:demethylmenaquinone methyltransferase/2-methoxy-6-polyprenyl-1,4-benzoquinol methylase
MPKAHRDYFNDLAPEWESMVEDLPVLRDYLLRFGVSQGERILDVGAGTGRLTKYLLELTGSDGWVVAEDVAEQMLIQAGKSIDSEHVRFVCDDVCSLALKSDSFDKVICFSLFPHILYPQKALSEICRVLRPGGRFLILHTSDSHDLNHFHATLNSVVCHDRLLPAGRMVPMLREAGLMEQVIEERENLYWLEAEKPEKN